MLELEKMNSNQKEKGVKTEKEVDYCPTEQKQRMS